MSRLIIAGTFALVVTATLFGFAATLQLSAARLTSVSSTLNNTSIDIALSRNDSVELGSVVHGSATLSGATSEAAGTVTYTVFGDDGCSTEYAPAGTKPVTNASVPNSEQVQLNEAGTFFWRVAYTGDANNRPATSSCVGLVVRQASPLLSLTPSSASVAIGESMKASGKLSNATSQAGGSVTYTIYSDSNCQVQFAQPVNATVAVTNGSVPDSPAYAFSEAKTFYWRAGYSGDANNAPTSSTCLEGRIDVTKNAPSLSTLLSAEGGHGPAQAISVPLGKAVTAHADLGGETSDAGGTIAYRYYTDSTCTQNASDATPASNTVVSGIVPTSEAINFSTAGTFYWQATYSGDANNEARTDDCNANLTLLKTTPTLTTTPSAGGVVGSVILNDQATLLGGESPSGTLTFRLYPPSNPSCSGGGVFSPVVSVTGNGNYSTDTAFTANAAGVWHWTVEYSGDGNNSSATSGCEAGLVTVTKATPQLSTDASDGIVGGTIMGMATLSGGYNLTGTISFSVFGPGDTSCALALSPAPESQTVSGAGDYTSGAFVPTEPGTYRWRAFYSGDPNNDAISGACNDANATSTVTQEISTLFLSMSPSNSLVTSGPSGSVNLESNAVNPQVWASAQPVTVSSSTGWVLSLRQTGPVTFQGAVLRVELWLAVTSCGTTPPSATGSNYVAGILEDVADTTLPRTLVLNLQANSGFVSPDAARMLCLRVTDVDGNGGGPHDFGLAAGSGTFLRGPF